MIKAADVFRVARARVAAIIHLTIYLDKYISMNSTHFRKWQYCVDYGSGSFLKESFFTAVRTLRKKTNSKKNGENIEYESEGAND